MCIPCEAAKERLFAAHKLRAAVEGRYDEEYGLGTALKAAFPPKLLGDELQSLARKLDN